ncbi:MAG: Lpg1974 family pore-forming outer membrane protein [Chlamydiales bacterium]
MRIYKWLIGLMLLGYMPITSAQNLTDCFSCEDFFCNTRYHVYADYLYWKTYRSAIGLATNDNDPQDLYLTPKYSSGYRVGGRILWNCLDLGVRYTSYDQTSKHNVALVILEDNVLNLKYNVDYQDVDVELGALFCFSCGNSFLRPYVGAKFVWLDEKVDSFAVSSSTLSGTIKLNDRAYGLYVGAEGKLGLFDLCNVAIGLRARGSFGLLDGRHQFRIRNGATFASECHLVGYRDLFAGLDISYCDCFCFDLNLQIGYELQQYIRDFNEFSTAQLGQVFALDNIAFAGLVVRFGVYF